VKGAYDKKTEGAKSISLKLDDKIIIHMKAFYYGLEKLAIKLNFFTSKDIGST